MPADDFDDDDLFEGITEEDLARAEFQASQHVSRRPTVKQEVPLPRRGPTSNPYTKQQPDVPVQRPYQPSRPQAVALGQAYGQPRPQQQAQLRPYGSTVQSSNIPAKRPFPAHNGHPDSSRFSTGYTTPSMQSALGRLPGTKRVQPPFKPPFKKPKTEAAAAADVAHVPLIPPPQIPVRPTPYRAAVAAAAAASAATGRGQAAANADDELDDDDDFWAGVDLDAEELIATQQVRATSVRPSASPEKVPSQREPVPPSQRSNARSSLAAPAVGRSVPSKEVATGAGPSAKAEQENAQLKQELEQMRQQLWSKQGEDKMLRQRLQKAETEKVMLEKEKEQMRQAHQEELRKINSQKDEDMKRMHDVAQFRAMEAETSRRTPQWPMRRPTAVHRSGSQFRTPQVLGLTTPTKSAERRRQEQERRLLSQDSPTRTATATTKQPPSVPVFPGFDNSFMVPALPVRNKSKVYSDGALSRTGPATAPETPKPAEAVSFEDYAFDNVADALSSPSRVAHIQTPKASPRAQEPVAPDFGLISATPAAWRLWARQVYAVRCGNLIGDLLAFSCSLPTPVPSLPRSRLLPMDVEPAPALAEHPLVVHRLMDFRLPDQACAPVKYLWQRAMERLLEICSDAGRHLPDSFFVHPAPVPAEERSTIVNESDRLFWLYQEQIEDAMLHLLQSLAAILRVLSTILLRMCMLDVLQDVLQLIKRLMVTNTNFVHAMLLPNSPLRALAMTLEHFNDGTDSQGYKVTGLLQPPPFARVLVEAVRKTYAVPLRVAHPPSAIDDPAAAGATSEGDQAWDVGVACREDLLEIIVECLQCLSLKDPQARIGVIAFIEEPGMVMTYINPNSSPDLQDAMLQVLIPFASAQFEWMNVLACDFPGDLPGYRRPMKARVPTPLVEMLGQQLAEVDDEWSWEDAHRLHHTALVFFTQMLIYHGDSARTFFGQSKELLAAIIKTLHRDSVTIWLQPDLVDKTDELELGRAAERICTNLRFLCLLTLTPTSTVDLVAEMRRLEAGRSTSHKGIRQLFNIAFGRIGCLASPDYLNQSERQEFVGIRAKLDQAYALANDILDKALTPDEVAHLYDEMGAIIEEPEDGADNDDETQTQTQTQTQSQTQDEDEDEMERQHGFFDPLL